MRDLVCLILLLCPILLHAQFTYVIDPDIPVKDQNNNTLALAWAGGLNAAHYNSMDLNGDQQEDLVLFDRMANKVITFINENNHYKHAPEYEALFPELTNWLALRDFNCDGKKDIFTGHSLGIQVYQNVTEEGQPLQWELFTFFAQTGSPKSPVLLTQGFSGKINLQMQFDDLPSITDIDGDGDLDILTMRFVGEGTAEFHKNFSMERYGSCDSLDFERITQTWGGFRECECGLFTFNDQPCPPHTGGRVNHAGGKALLAIDIDNDQDQDLLFSEAECTRIFLLTNEGNSENPIFTNAINFPESDPINFLIFPAASYEDVDFDGKKDLIAFPNIFSKEFFDTNLKASNWFYKNTGSSQTPSFSLSRKNLLQDQMIDVGDNAVPAFADIDGDGDFDMLIGQSTTPGRGASLFLYENNGDPTNPSFQLITEDFYSISILNLYNIKPQFIDINTDGKIDLVFTATNLFNFQTRIFYILNKSNTGIDFSGQTALAIDFSLTSLENVHFTDVNLDGLPDILIGRSNGSVGYWKNNGNLNFSLEKSSFLGFSPGILNQNLSFSSGDLNGDGKAELVLGNNTGVVSIVDNFREASSGFNAHTTILFNPLLDTYTSYNFGARIWPAIVNLYNTNKPIIVIGNTLGGLHVLKNDESQTLPNKPVVWIFPNPVEKSQVLHIRADRAATVQVLSRIGQELNEPFSLQPNQIYPFNVSSLSSGLYLLKITAGTKTITRRFVIY